MENKIDDFYNLYSNLYGDVNGICIYYKKENRRNIGSNGHDYSFDIIYFWMVSKSFGGRILYYWNIYNIFDNYTLYGHKKK